jgi:hypothetical protein
MPPAMRAVMPLMPEPIVQHDGTDKHDGERHAANRLVAKLRQDHPHLTCIVTEDSRSANAPHIQTLQDHPLHSILGGKEGEHALLVTQVQEAEHAGRVTYDERHDRAAGVVHRFRLVNAVPLNASQRDVRVHVIASWERGDDQVHPCRWVTDLRVSPRNGYRLMQGGRARWKSETATCNTLTNQGDHFAHTSGHGEQQLSVGFAMLMRLAVLVDQTQPLCCVWCQAVWTKLGSNRLLWERMRALLYDDAFAAMRQLFAALWYGFQTFSPIVAMDSSSSPSLSSGTAGHRTR